MVFPSIVFQGRKKGTMVELTRRNFLAGTSVALAGIAGAAALSSCSNNISSESADGNMTADDAVSGIKEATQTRNVDIVIVGSGAAGCFAAYEAKKQGVESVLVVTKSGGPMDSNFNDITGTCAVETEGTKAIGQDFTLADLYQHMIAFAHWTVDARLLHKCVMMLAEDIDILSEMGVETQILGDRYNVGFTVVHGFTTQNKGVPIENFLTDKGIEFMYGAPATHILMNGDKAAGVQCEQDGEVINVNAKAVLICTGGYMANEEMLNEVYGGVTVVNMGSPNNTGDGQRMVLEVGGMEDRIHGLGMNDIYGMNKKSTISVFNANPFMQLAFYGGLVTGPDGRRFVNEYMLAQQPMSGGGEATLHQQRYYAIFSGDVVNTMKDSSYYASIGSPAVWTSAATMFNAPLADFDTNLQRGIEEGWIFQGATIEDLAEAAGLANLPETVKDYDAMVAAGEDTEFYKRAEFLQPIEDSSAVYYAFEYNPSAFNTFGGARTDANCCVLDATFNPIDGLYVAGVENGSLYCTPYYDCGGSCSGLAMASGRVAAQHMTTYIKEI